MSFLGKIFGKTENKSDLLLRTCEDVRQFVEGSKKAVTGRQVADDDDKVLLFIIGALTGLAEKRKLGLRDTVMMFFTGYLNIDATSVQELLTRLQAYSGERRSVILHMSGSNAIKQWLADNKSGSALSELSRELDYANTNGRH